LSIPPGTPCIITTGAPHWSKLEDFGGRQFLVQNDRDGPSNVRFLVIQPPDAVGRPRRFYWI
jgi:hypothetical protein